MSGRPVWDSRGRPTVEAAADAGAANALLVKVNQASAVTEAKQAFDAARAAGWVTIVSARFAGEDGLPALVRPRLGGVSMRGK